MTKRIRILRPVQPGFSIDLGRDGTYLIEIHQEPTPSTHDRVPFVYYIRARGANGHPSIPLSVAQPTAEKARHDWANGFAAPADMDFAARRIVLALLASGAAEGA
jgi:hypothetical protein